MRDPDMLTTPDFQAEQAGRTLDIAFSAIVSLAIIVMMAVLCLFFIFEPVVIEGRSMENTLFDDETVVINRFDRKVSRGDIVVAEHDGTRIIKRVAAVGGDRLAFCLSGDEIEMYLDTGEGLVKRTEDYISEPMSAKSLEYEIETGRIFREFDVAESPEKIESCAVTVPEGQIVLLGDNRNVSRDSRYYGPVSAEEVVGTFVTELGKKNALSEFFSILYGRRNNAKNSVSDTPVYRKKGVGI